MLPSVCSKEDDLMTLENTHNDGMCNPLDWHMNYLHKFQQW